MKTSLLRTFFVALAVAVGGYAQSARAFKADIPFDFVIGNQTLPAGEYTVEQALVSSAVVVKSVEHKGNAIVMSNSVISANAGSAATLVFHVIGTVISSPKFGQVTAPTAAS